MTIENATAYPLAWPSGWKRTPGHDQARGKFGRKDFHRYTHMEGGYMRSRQVTIADGVGRILDALEKLGAEAVVISTNAELRRDGYPRSDKEPRDAGAAVYWRLTGESECMAIDRYDRLADNLAAIAATIEALRAIERHGGAEILKRTFQGFKQLPGGGGSGAPSGKMGLAAAWDTLERFGRTSLLVRTLEPARMAYRLAMKFTHPDRGGSDGDFQLVQSAAASLSAHFGEKL